MQTRYNLPLEIFYTIAPVIMVVVFFFFTVDTPERRARRRRRRPRPHHRRSSASSGRGPSTTTRTAATSDGRRPRSSTSVGTTGRPADARACRSDKTVAFNLHSPDVIHAFGVPGFLLKMDVIPGRDNHFALTPDRDRHLRGQVRRALRRLPLADALQRQGRQPGRRTTPTSRTLADAGQRRTSRCSAAPTPARRPGSSPTTARRRGVTATAPSTAGTVRRRAASRSASRSSASSPPPTTS